MDVRKSSREPERDFDTLLDASEIYEAVLKYLADKGVIPPNTRAASIFFRTQGGDIDCRIWWSDRPGEFD